MNTTHLRNCHVYKLKLFVFARAASEFLAPAARRGSGPVGQPTCLPAAATAPLPLACSTRWRAKIGSELSRSLIRMRRGCDEGTGRLGGRRARQVAAKRLRTPPARLARARAAVQKINFAKRSSDQKRSQIDASRQPGTMMSGGGGGGGGLPRLMMKQENSWAGERETATSTCARPLARLYQTLFARHRLEAAACCATSGHLLRGNSAAAAAWLPVAQFVDVAHKLQLCRGVQLLCAGATSRPAALWRRRRLPHRPLARSLSRA